MLYYLSIYLKIKAYYLVQTFDLKMFLIALTASAKHLSTAIALEINNHIYNQLTYAALRSSPWSISATATGYIQRLAKSAFWQKEA